MSKNTFPIKIRGAVASQYETIGKLHALAFADGPMYNLLHSAIPADVVLQWIWIDGALAGVRKGYDRVMILERDDTKEIIGLAWFYEYNKENSPILLPESWPEGFNKVEDIKMAKPRYEWQMELLQKYGEYISGFLPLSPFSQIPAYMHTLLRPSRICDPSRLPVARPRPSLHGPSRLSRKGGGSARDRAHR